MQDATDVHQTLEYRKDANVMKGVPYALGFCLLGLTLVTFGEYPETKHAAVAWLAVLGGAGWTALAFYRRAYPSRPMFALSPTGIHYHDAKEVIPWRAIEDMGAIDITVGSGRRQVTLCDVTVAIVSREFYDAHVAIPTLFGPARGWNFLFVPKGSVVQCALHHELVSVERRAVREAVEARWHAFRDRAPAPDALSATGRRTSVPIVMAAWKRAIGTSGAAPPAGPARNVVAVGGRPRLTPVRTWVSIALLIGIAVVLTNLVGLWSTPGQIAAREARKKWAEEEARRDAESKELQDKATKIQKDLDEYFRRAR